MKHDRVVLQSEDFKSEEQNLCEKVVTLSVRILQMKSKINKLVEKDLYCNNMKNSKNEKKILLKKQLVKTSEFEKSEK